MMQLADGAGRLTDLQEEENAIEKEDATLESQVSFLFTTDKVKVVRFFVQIV